MRTASLSQAAAAGRIGSGRARPQPALTRRPGDLAPVAPPAQDRPAALDAPAWAREVLPGQALAQAGRRSAGGGARTGMRTGGTAGRPTSASVMQGLRGGGAGGGTHGGSRGTGNLTRSGGGRTGSSGASDRSTSSFARGAGGSRTGMGAGSASRTGFGAAGRGFAGGGAAQVCVRAAQQADLPLHRSCRDLGAAGPEAELVAAAVARGT